MKLALIKDDGTVIPVIEDIEGYDLSFPLAMSEIADAIQRELKKQNIRSGKGPSPDRKE
jgi:hypothetical protein